jgi:hypothetical protein
MTLLIEAAATGFAQFGKNPNAAQRPRLTRLAMLELSPEGDILSEWCELVRPGCKIAADATDFWGITDQQAARGVPPADAIAALIERVGRAKRVTGYALETHRRFCEGSAYDLALDIVWPEKCCLMLKATKTVGKTNALGKLAWPKMTETREFLFGEQAVPRGAAPRENGLALARAGAAIYQELVRRGAIAAVAE